MRFPMLWTNFGASTSLLALRPFPPTWEETRCGIRALTYSEGGPRSPARGSQERPSERLDVLKGSTIAVPSYFFLD